jgi:hypothetical protein
MPIFDIGYNYKRVMKMDKKSTLNKLEKEIEQLTISEQLELIERIIRRIKN